MKVSWPIVLFAIYLGFVAYLVSVKTARSVGPSADSQTLKQAVVVVPDKKISEQEKQTQLLIKILGTLERIEKDLNTLLPGTKPEAESQM